MKIYLSYSLSPTDLHIASMLARQAQAKGMIVETAQQIAPGSDWAGSAIIVQQLFNSDVIIAIISRDSRNIANVERELEVVRTLKKPALVLIEKGVYAQINIADIQRVEFDRRDLSPALSRISLILEGQNNQENLKNWLTVGGLALLALYLFGKEK